MSSTFVSILVALIPVGLTEGPEVISIGFVEFPPDEWRDQPDGQGRAREAYARVAFVNSGGEWHACSTRKEFWFGNPPKPVSCPTEASPPEAAVDDDPSWHERRNLEQSRQCGRRCPFGGEWQVSFEGKHRGNLLLSLPNEPSHAQSPPWLRFNVDESKVPRIADDFQRPAWWSHEHSSFRHLLIHQNGNISDPEKWRPVKVTPSSRKLALAAFRKQFPSVENCRNVDESFPSMTSYRVPNKDLSIASVWQSKSKELLVEVMLVKGYNCDGPWPDPWGRQFFFIDRTGRSEYMESGLLPIDVMDVDGDGKSEWFFWRAAYNENGYVMYFDNMKQSARFIWSYH